eukprot:13074065-Alexandrium_andersonii.AAC.1
MDERPQQSTADALPAATLGGPNLGANLIRNATAPADPAAAPAADDAAADRQRRRPPIEKVNC